MNHLSLRRKAGFTMIEILVVMAIIAILASMVIGALGFVKEKQKREQAKLQIALLGKGIDDYKLDMGKLPGIQNDSPASGEGMTQELYQALFYEGYLANENPSAAPTTASSAASATATRVYVAELDPTITKQKWVDVPKGNKTIVPNISQIKDPWGNEYRYRKGASAFNPDFDLWSTGKDGLTVSGNSPQDLKDPKSLDDVRNF
jgi:prepilin-type N-terminal cleavage/methylation domain-containing protein